MAQTGPMEEAWQEVRLAARGERHDYALEPRPLDDLGGQAVVFTAKHKATGVTVAFKKVRSRSADSLARMRREISVSRDLAQCRQVMPVLDASPHDDWLVMPMARGNAVAYQSRLSASPDDRLRRFVESVAQGLEAAHDKGWVHRDVKPANILRFSDGVHGRWVVADWGLGRGPRGQTTDPNRTRVGIAYGTEGFAPPELAVDAHGATPAADIYSVGQVIGWVLTGRWPQPNVPLLPASGPWRAVVRAATRLEAVRRPKSIADFLQVVRNELDGPPVDPIGEAEQLADAAGAGDHLAAIRLLRLAEERPDDYELHVDLLPRLTADSVRAAVASEGDLALAAVRALDNHVDGEWGHRNFRWADEVIRFLHHVAQSAAENGDIDLLEESSAALFAWDGKWDQWGPQPAIRTWLGTLRGEAAGAVAATLRAHPDSAAHFDEVANARQADHRVRAAIRSR